MTSMCETLNRLQRLSDAVSRTAEPNAIMALGQKACDEEFSFKLFTIQTVNTRTGFLERVWSSNLDVNPLGIKKPLQGWQFASLVVDQREQFVGQTREVIKATFFDHAILFAIGCQSILSTPVQLRGECVGLVNILNADENFFDETMIARARLYSQALLPAFINRS